MKFQDKAVLVTGGATGIGKATAIAFADAGARVLVASRDAARGAAFEGEMRAAGRTIEFAACDLLEDGAPEALIAEAVRKLGRLDVLFNNAGIHHRFGTLETTNAHWAETMALNVGAVFMCSREAAIAPGDTFTSMIEHKIRTLWLSLEDGRAWLAAPVAMKRLAEVGEIARAVLFLASDDASYVTGTTLSVDGGTSASGPGGQRPAANV